MSYPKFIVTNDQKESISKQRVNCVCLHVFVSGFLDYNVSSLCHVLIHGVIGTFHDHTHLYVECMAKDKYSSETVRYILKQTYPTV